MEYIAMLIAGLFVVALGVTNLLGNVSTINSYNRRKVSAEDMPSYAKVMGIGTVIIGLSIAVTAVLKMFIESDLAFWLTGVGLFIGIAIKIYAQIKYNRGIF